MPYPLGTEVVVDGDVLGVVCKVDADEPWMPTVRRLADGEVAETVVDLRHLDATQSPSEECASDDPELEAA
jgi:hypothetical protein